MSSSIDNADNTSTCVEDKEGDDSTENLADKQLALQIDHLSIEMASTNNADNTDNITILCAACGKEGGADSMNICNKCKIVHYCNVACKKKHKSKHKKKCDRRVAELHEVALFKELSPPEECPICFLPMPIDDAQSMFKPCCGKKICMGCIHAIALEGARKGKKKKLACGICAFCRTPPPSSMNEEVKRLQNLMESGNADAYHQLACYYANGRLGLQQDWVKANELWLKAGELGCANAYSRLGYSYANGMGVEADKKKANHYWELAAMMGDVMARYNLGALESEAGNHERTYKHMSIAARAGHTESLDAVKIGFSNGHVTKDEYESTLRAYHERQTEMKSDTRADSIAFLEWNGSR